MADVELWQEWSEPDDTYRFEMRLPPVAKIGMSKRSLAMIEECLGDLKEELARVPDEIYGEEVDGEVMGVAAVEVRSGGSGDGGMSESPLMGQTVARPELPLRVAAAVRTLSRVLWKQPYIPGQGPMHYADGPAQRAAVLRQAERWEKLAESARAIADYLPDGEDFHDVPARRTPVLERDA
jgi:hypothetical protein